MDLPIVDVLIPATGPPASLGVTLSSLANQRYPSFRVTATRPPLDEAEEPELPHAPPELPRDAPGVLPCLDVGRDLLLHEGADGLAQHLVLDGEDVVLHGALPSPSAARVTMAAQISASPRRVAHSATYRGSISPPDTLSIPRMSRTCTSDPPSR